MRQAGALHPLRLSLSPGNRQGLKPDKRDTVYVGCLRRFLPRYLESQRQDSMATQFQSWEPQARWSAAPTWRCLHASRLPGPRDVLTFCKDKSVPWRQAALTVKAGRLRPHFPLVRGSLTLTPWAGPPSAPAGRASRQVPAVPSSRGSSYPPLTVSQPRGPSSSSQRPGALLPGALHTWLPCAPPAPPPKRPPADPPSPRRPQPSGSILTSETAHRLLRVSEALCRASSLVALKARNRPSL